MIGLLCFVLAVLASPFKLKLRLEAENELLRHQLIVLSVSGMVALKMAEAQKERAREADRQEKKTDRWCPGLIKPKSAALKESLRLNSLWCAGRTPHRLYRRCASGR